MEVILIQDVNNLGGTNEVVKVKNGYARNFLIPRKMALEATPGNLKMLEERMKGQKKREDKMMAEINEVIAKLAEGPVRIATKVGTTNKIYGSVTTVIIARAIREQKGYEIDRRRIHLADEVKELGSYKAKIDFGNGKEAEVEFEVVPE